MLLRQEGRGGNVSWYKYVMNEMNGKKVDDVRTCETFLEMKGRKT